MTLNVRTFDAALGAEVRDVDLSKPPDDETFAAIKEAYNEHSVLLFREQSIDKVQHLAFSRRFGDLEVHVLDQYLHPEHPEILIVSNVMDGDRHVGIYDAGRYWHTDLSYMAVPSRGSLLYAIEVPHDEDGKPLGDTLFASTSAAYDALSDSMKSRIADLKAEFSLANRHAKLVADGDANAELEDRHHDRAPPAVHKIVRTHPITGRKSIYVNEGQTARILDLPEDEARDLLEKLCTHCTKPEFVYRHKWRPGDLLMWDNIPTQHLAICDYALPQRRYLHRTTLRGTPPQ
ncbi:MAG: TauD/TfdA family dioxygenase [Rhodospirillaceae bacterium]|nr:TauD/TfdA family dioxygenase [Rhodospirillaceae bacterium]